MEGNIRGRYAPMLAAIARKEANEVLRFLARAYIDHFRNEFEKLKALLALRRQTHLDLEQPWYREPKDHIHCTRMSKPKWDRRFCTNVSGRRDPKKDLRGEF